MTYSIAMPVLNLLKEHGELTVVVFSLILQSKKK